MNNIKILDCTLRDGGYINDWNFGKSNISKFIEGVSLSGIEYIEVGFLKNTLNNQNRTVFNNFEKINDILPQNLNKNTKITAMLVFGKFNQDKIIKKNSNIKLDALRFNFKKYEIPDAVECMEKIKDFGYEIFVCPANIEMFSEKELIELLTKVNQVKPACFSIVDTNGLLNKYEAEKIFNIVDKILDSQISIGFHSHNNLKLSLSNACHLMKIGKNRNLVIDSSVCGMGRGAGNLSTEKILKYLNNKKYDLTPIINIAKSIIKPIHQEFNWGFAEPYYLTAINRCHPNYAKYLINNGITNGKSIDTILKLLPINEKSLYNENKIKELLNLQK